MLPLLLLLVLPGNKVLRNTWMAPMQLHDCDLDKVLWWCCNHNQLICFDSRSSSFPLACSFISALRHMTSQPWTPVVLHYLFLHQCSPSYDVPAMDTSCPSLLHTLGSSYPAYVYSVTEISILFHCKSGGTGPDPCNLSDSMSDVFWLLFRASTFRQNRQSRETRCKDPKHVKRNTQQRWLKWN